MNHKHDGLLTSSGGLRSHPIDRGHKDPSVQKEHNKSLSSRETRFSQGKTPTTKVKSKARTKAKTPTKKYSKTESAGTSHFDDVEAIVDTDAVLCQIDKDEYINIDVDSIPQKGVRLKFTRKEGRKKRTIGLTIDRV